MVLLTKPNYYYKDEFEFVFGITALLDEKSFNYKFKVLEIFILFPGTKYCFLADIIKTFMHTR